MWNTEVQVIKTFSFFFCDLKYWLKVITEYLAALQKHENILSVLYTVASDALLFCSLPEQWKHASSIQSPLQTSHLSNPGALFFLSDACAALLVVFTFLLRIKHCLLWYAKHKAKLKEHTRRRGAREGPKETFAPNEEPQAVGVNFLQSWWASEEFDLFWFS